MENNRSSKRKFCAGCSSTMAKTQYYDHLPCNANKGTFIFQLKNIIIRNQICVHFKMANFIALISLIYDFDYIHSFQRFC